MPVAGPDGHARIVICTGSGPLELVASADGEFLPAVDTRAADEQPADAPAGDKTMCDWALHAQMALEAIAPAPPAFVSVQIPLREDLSSDQVRHRLVPSIRHARAPPAVFS